MDFALQAPPLPYDPLKAKQLLAEAGYPNGLDAGEFVPIPGFSTVGEAVLNNLNAAGIRCGCGRWSAPPSTPPGRRRSSAVFSSSPSGNSGNAASRVEAFIYSKGAYAYGGYPDIDEMFLQQARERDPAKREVLLHRIQQLTIDRVDVRAAHGSSRPYRRRTTGGGPHHQCHADVSVPVPRGHTAQEPLANLRQGSAIPRADGVAGTQRT